MIFVTVGTHEQQFDRLVSYMDNLKKQGHIREKVVIQTGYSTYLPRYCEYKEWFSYDEMVKNVSDARIVITHGGPSSFIMPLQLKKIPIVVPRWSDLGEHVNDHQVNFTKAFSDRSGSIIPVFDIEKLRDIIIHYDDIVQSMSAGIRSNNSEFNRRFEELVNGLFGEEDLRD